MEKLKMLAKYYNFLLIVYAFPSVVHFRNFIFYRLSSTIINNNNNIIITIIPLGAKQLGPNRMKYTFKKERCLFCRTKEILELSLKLI